MKLQTIIVVIFSLYSTLVFSNNCDSFDALSWLEGEWHNSGSKVQVIETWKQVSAGTYEGISETKSAKGKSLESMRLVNMSGTLFYIAKVEHNKLPIAFKMSTCSASEFVFTNLSHDFPKRIAYRKVKDQLEVNVGDGADKHFTLHFKRFVENNE